MRELAATHDRGRSQFTWSDQAYLDNFGATEVAGDVAHVLALLFQVEPLLIDGMLLLLMLLLLLEMLILRGLWSASQLRPSLLVLRILLVVEGAGEHRILLIREGSRRGLVVAR